MKKTFFRKLWTIYAKNETSAVFIKGFQKLFPEKSCNEILVDFGSQFHSQATQAMLKQRNIITKTHGG